MNEPHLTFARGLLTTSSLLPVPPPIVPVTLPEYGAFSIVTSHFDVGEPAMKQPVKLTLALPLIVASVLPSGVTVAVELVHSTVSRLVTSFGPVAVARIGSLAGHSFSCTPAGQGF